MFRSSPFIKFEKTKSITTDAQKITTMVMIDFRRMRSTSMISQMDSIDKIEKNSTANISTEAVIFFILSTIV